MDSSASVVGSASVFRHDDLVCDSVINWCRRRAARRAVILSAAARARLVLLAPASKHHCMATAKWE